MLTLHTKYIISKKLRRIIILFLFILCLLILYRATYHVEYDVEEHYRIALLKAELSEADRSFCEMIDQQISSLNSTFKSHYYINQVDIDLLDVTLVTQMSCDRIEMMILLLKHWQGPISLALYCNEKDASKFVQQIVDYRYPHYISIHVVCSHEKQFAFYPINYLRNIALTNALTEYVFLCDADFVPSYGLHKYLKTAARIFLTSFTEINRALVVPAFEEKSKMSFFPTNKKDLENLYHNNIVSRFHDYFVGHLPTNYPKWFKQSFAYRVNWKLDYEPYVVVRRTDVPLYNESFIGYGFNKLVHIAELQALKYEFVVLPNEFLIHRIHPKTSEYKLITNNEHVQNCLKFKYCNFLWRFLPAKYGKGWDRFRREHHTYDCII